VKYTGKTKPAPRTGRSMTFGNNSGVGTGEQVGNGDGAHTVKGIGRVQRAASKRIFGEAAVGAGIDSSHISSKFPSGKAPGLHPNKKQSQRVPHVVPTAKDTF
jgi:hypothetical protein